MTRLGYRLSCLSHQCEMVGKRLAHELLDFFAGLAGCNAARYVRSVSAPAAIFGLLVDDEVVGRHRSIVDNRHKGRFCSCGDVSSGVADAWVYMLRCVDGSLYTGWSTDVERRLAQHRAGNASKYTASRLPVELVYAAAMDDRTAARREEARIKRLRRHAKLALIGRASPFEA